MNDTICAIATAQGVGAISIIRVSGEESTKIVDKIFQGKDLTKVASHTINYGHIIDNNEVIDEVLVSVMKSPKTFTTEDVVEINTHGGIAATNRTLELLLENGCRLAEPGEFTKIAFLNGRIDLLEAEAIMDMIDAKTEKQRKMAVNQIDGKTSNLINELRNDMVQIISNINVNIDYPEYDDVDIITNDLLIPKITKLKEKIKKILKESENGKIIKEGIKTTIIGRPNVGKSSLLNALLQEDKAIVTNIAGTTRDIVEGQISINGILLNMIDTAGIRKTDDVVEKIGVEMSLSKIDEADLILVILNNNEKLNETDLEILEKTKDKPSIVVINKNDLTSKIDTNVLKGRNIVYTNTVNLLGMEELKDKINKMFNLEQIKTSDYNYITNVRQISKIKECLNKITDINNALVDNMPLDIIEIDLRDIWSILGEIIGESYTDELLDELFSRFCVGK